MADLVDPVSLLLPRRTAQWPLWSMMALGLYMTAVPFLYGWPSEAALVSGLCAGMAVFGLALFCRLHPPMGHLAYLNAFIGAGVLGLRLLEAAPGPLWDGPALIALALVIPATSPLPAADTPPGWFHNPSTWVQRLPLVGLGVLGALGTRGAPWASAAAMLALFCALTGDRRRWRTAPWVLFFGAGAAAGSLVVSATRMYSLPSAGASASAIAGLLMIALSVDELVAAKLFLTHAPQLGQRSWDAFWNGGLLPRDEFAPRPTRRPQWAPPKPVQRRHSRRRQPQKKPLWS
jgi:hypothetical protein